MKGARNRYRKRYFKNEELFVFKTVAIAFNYSGIGSPLGAFPFLSGLAEDNHGKMGTFFAPEKRF